MENQEVILRNGDLKQSPVGRGGFSPWRPPFSHLLCLLYNSEETLLFVRKFYTPGRAVVGQGRMHKNVKESFCQ